MCTIVCALCRAKLLFYENDPQLPIYDTPTCGCPVNDVIDILLNIDIQTENVCTVQPLGVTQNCLFIVDIDSVEFDDIRSDDLGSWKATGTKKVSFKVLKSGAIKVYKTRSSNNASYLLTRRYFIHSAYNKYHRMIADVKGMIYYKICACTTLTNYHP